MKVVVTGGSGFLGRHLGRRFSGRGDEALLLDLVPLDPSACPPGGRSVVADVRDAGALEKLFAGAGAVVHAAAALPLCRREEILDVNVNGTRGVLEAARRAGVPKVVYISSTAVYGVPRKYPVEEQHPLQGIGPYGQSKIEAEQVCRDYGGRGLAVSILRPKTFIGAGRMGIFQILFDWVERGGRIPVIGDGKNRYQLLEVEDLVDAIELCASAAGLDGTGAQMYTR